ncbi:sensor histidine kinase [Rhodovulum sp. DZ06]|uniref:sensor histidine kinase n=1 Tax=Rhodovulum sp. DZ06 TaxID=3425126 RepID=UPI003D32929D
MDGDPPVLQTPERLQDLAAWALHDLRAPLRAFDATLEMLDAGGGNPQALAIAARAARRMGATLDGLARYAEHHASPLQIGPVQPLEAVEAAWAAAAATWEDAAEGAGDAQADAAADEPGDAPTLRARSAAASHAARGRPAATLETAPALAHAPPCLADAGALQAILSAVFDNAARYGRAPHGAARVRVEAGARDGMLRLLVRDDGPGVPRHLAGDAFEPLRRLVARSEVEGAGLGLAVARLLAVRQNGRIDFIAAPRGACISLKLPLFISPT